MKNEKNILGKIIYSSSFMRKFLVFASLILLIIIFSLMSPYFLKTNNLIGILLSTTIKGILAIGVTFVIISGGIELSTGTLMSFCSIMTAVFIVWWKLPIPIGIIMGILVGLLFGFINGIIIVKMKVASFVATLGTMMVAKVLSLIISNASPIYFTETPVFSKICIGSIIGRIPNGVWVFFILAVIASFILSNTILGRYTFAIEGNREATRLSGVKVDLWNIIISDFTVNTIH